MPAMAMDPGGEVEQTPSPAMVAMAETSDPVLPMAINGPTPSERPSQAVAACGVEAGSGSVNRARATAPLTATRNPAVATNAKPLRT